MGHADPFCPTPGQRDAKGELPFGSSLRAEERKKATSGDSAGKEHHAAPGSQRESKNSSNVPAGGTEVNSPRKKNSNLNKRKEAPRQVYRRVENASPLLLTASGEGTQNPEPGHPEEQGGGVDIGTQRKYYQITKKKKPTPENSAEAAMQPCLSQCIV